MLVFYNGSNDLSYFAIDLTGSTNAQGYYTIGNTGVAGVDQTFSGNFLQNGADAVALYVGSAASFPHGTAITTLNLLDAVVYDTGQADDAALLVLLNSGQPQVNENTGSASTTNSIQRCPNGSGGTRNTSTYATFAPTPDTLNTCGVVAVSLLKNLLAMFGFEVETGGDARVDGPRYFCSPLPSPSAGKELTSESTPNMYGWLIHKDISKPPVFAPTDYSPGRFSLASFIAPTCWPHSNLPIRGLISRALRPESEVLP